MSLSKPSIDKDIKDSGIDWLGEVPSNWFPSKIRAITNTVVRKNRPELILLSVYRDHGVIPRDSRDDNFNRLADDLTHYKEVRPGNLVLNKMKTWQGSLAISSHHGIVSPAYIVCELKGENNPRFIHYLLRSHPYIYEYNRISYGVRVNQWDMRYQNFKSIPIFIPPCPEQDAIVNYLDSKLAKIDKYITGKQKMIKLLDEQKNNIISHVVTKGLDPDVEMKDLGIEWLGEIPKHWSFEKLGYNAKMVVPMRDKPPIFDGEIPWIRIEDFDGKYIADSKTNQRVSYDIINSLNLKIFPIGTVLCSCSCKMGATAIVNRPLISNQTFIGIVPYSTLDSTFLYYIIIASGDRLQYLGLGAIQEYMAKEDFQGLKIAFPLLSEQKKIADYLDDKLSEIERLNRSIKHKIQFAQEYRTALIADTVTGKIKVPVHSEHMGTLGGA